MTQHFLAQQFADWACGFRLADAPRPAVHAARRAILDTLGVMAAGGSDAGFRRFAEALPGSPGKSAAANGRLVQAEHAALLNGFAAHLWDYDDTSYAGIMHGSAVVLPTALALVQEDDGSERTLIEAFIVGSEIAYTLGQVCTHRHYLQGWWSTATFGLVAATAAAARILGCDRQQMASAIGLAASSAGVGQSAFGTNGKPLLVGETSRRAVTFARAAASGLTGPADGLDGPKGFLKLMNEGIAEAHHAETLGQRWRLIDPGLLIKTNPVCSAAHAAIEQMAILMRQIPGGPDSIQTIEADVPQLVKDSLRYSAPKSPQEAQFSLPYALACAALHGRVRLADLAERELLDPAKQALMAKVVGRVAADLSTDELRARYPESARLTIRRSDGREVSGFCGDALGMPCRPLSDADLLEKFGECLDHADIDAPEINLKLTNLLHLASGVLGNLRAGSAGAN